MNLFTWKRTAILLFVTGLLGGWLGYERFHLNTNRISVLEGQVKDLARAIHPKLRVREGTFTIGTAGGGNYDFQLTNNPGELQRFRTNIWKEPGHVISAWISDWSPRSEIIRFDKLEVVGAGNEFKLLV